MKISSILVYLFIHVAFSNGWKTDIDFKSMIPKACDIQEIEAFEDIENMVSNWETPFIVRGLAKKWNANQRWNRISFLELYGNKTLKYGTQHSIVFGGGSAELQITVSQFIRGLDANVTNAASAFIFQPSILQEIPELRDDFSVPSIFSSWDTKKKEDAAELWHMLSIGASREGTGLKISFREFG